MEYAVLPALSNLASWLKSVQVNLVEGFRVSAEINDFGEVALRIRSSTGSIEWARVYGTRERYHVPAYLFTKLPRGSTRLI